METEIIENKKESIKKFQLPLLERFRVIAFIKQDIAKENLNVNIEMLK